MSNKIPDSEINRPSFFAIIPAHVRYCKALEMGARLLYGELTALSNTYGYCWASNEYFAELYEVDIRTIKRWLESLKKLKFISIEIGKTGIKTIRKIWISGEIKKMFTKGQKCPPRGDKNVPPGDPSPYYCNSTEEENTSEQKFGQLAASFFAKLKEANPKIKQADLKKWAKELALLSKDGEGSTIEEIEQVIDYVLATRNKPSGGTFCWANNILSPESLRKHYAKLWGEMKLQKESSSNPLKNKELAGLIASKFKRNDIVLGTSYVEFINGVNAPSTEIKFGDKDFRNKCLEQLRKRKLNTEGL